MKLMPPDPTEEMISKGLMALLQCSHSDLDGLSADAINKYEDEIKRVYSAMYAAAPNIEHEEIEKLKREKEMLVEAVSKASAHVRPTCVELYDYLQEVIEKVKG